MTLETLIDCAKLHDLYTNGFGDGPSDHSTHIYLPKIQSTTAQASSQSHLYSAPSLTDLLNEETISPLDVGHTQKESEWFDQPDPYDLDEGTCFDADNLDFQHITCCASRRNVANVIRLDSEKLGSLISYLAGDSDTDMLAVERESGDSLFDLASNTGHPNEWDMGDYL
jgi:hypothetical protein